MKYGLKYLYDGKDRLKHSHGTARTVKIVSVTPIQRTKSLIVKAEAYGSSLYAVTLVLYDLAYQPTADKEHPIRTVDKLGNEAYIQQLKFSNARVQVRCTCMDFRMTWAYYNKENKALSGPAFPKYVRKTTTRPERNPEHTPGLCKHVKTLVERLIQDRIIVR